MQDKKINVLNKVFSRKTFYDILDLELSNSYIVAVNKYVEDPNEKLNIELFQELYKRIRKNYRNEYFYKNTLLNTLLLGVHSINTTTVLTELTVTRSKADFILLNGKAVVYEIKTELDNFERLEQQIHDYYKVFDHVAVVIPDNDYSLSALNKTLDKLEYPVGIYVLRRNCKLGRIKEATPFTNNLDFENMFKLLRKNEYEQLVLKFYGELPSVTQFKYYSECKKVLSTINIHLFYKEYLEVLKKRVKVKKEWFDNIPYELKFVTYCMNLKEQDYVKLEKFLTNPYGGVE